MGTNEEYLDKLLQSVTSDEKTSEPEHHDYDINMTDDELLASLIEMYSEELAEFKDDEIIHKEQTEEVSDEMQDNNGVVENVPEIVAEPVIEESVVEEEEQTEQELAPAEQYTSTDGDYMSQDDIEALLNSLQDELPQDTSEVVDADKLMEDFSESQDAIFDELLSEPQTIEAEDADLLIRDKSEDEFEFTEKGLLEEMGIETMSAEQIDDLLNAAAESEKPQESSEMAGGEMGLDALFGGLDFADDFDPEHNASEEMADLLGGMLGGNDDLAEINDLLSKADSNENADDSNLRNLLDTEDEIGGNDLLNELLQADSGVVAEESPKKKKVKKEKQPKEKKDGENLWKKFTSVLFEEDEEFDENKKVKVEDVDELAALIEKDGNDDVFAEMINGDKQKDKKKDKKKSKKDKGNKSKQENATSEDGEEVIDPKEQERQAKLKEKAEKKAAKKKAKEEKKAADIAFLKAQPSISTKRAMVAVMFAFSLMAIILLIYNFVPDAIEKANARKAFYNKDYYESYELLQGKDLNDSDKILLNKVTCILKLQRKVDSYNNYVKMDKPLEAINFLMEAVALYEKNNTYAKALSIDEEYSAIYDEVLLILNGRYAVTEEMAKEINACESDAQYTINLYNIIEGNGYGSVEEGESNKPMEDILPEEEDFLEGQ